MITSKISRLALVSGFAILGTVALTPKSQAQSVNVDFEGNNPATCSVTPTAGILEVVSNARLESNSTKGTPGKLTVTCNAGTTITIDSIANNGSNFSTGNFSNVQYLYVEIYDGATQVLVADENPIGDVGHAVAFATPKTSAVQAGPITNKDYDVYLTVTNDSPADPLPVGTYNVRVAVSLAPQ